MDRLPTSVSVLCLCSVARGKPSSLALMAVVSSSRVLLLSSGQERAERQLTDLGLLDLDSQGGQGLRTYVDCSDQMERKAETGKSVSVFPQLAYG